jgi:hypothetical protein
MFLSRSKLRRNLIHLTPVKGVSDGEESEKLSVTLTSGMGNSTAGNYISTLEKLVRGILVILLGREYEPEV